MSKKMTTRTRTVLTLVAVAMAIVGLTTTSASADAVLKVDFNSNQDGGGDSTTAGDPGLSAAAHNQAGWPSYHANHEVIAEFTTANYDGITVTPDWPNTTDNRARQSIDRGTGNDDNWDDAAGDLNLVTDWIGIDTRTGNGGNGNWDGTTGTPTYMTLALGGLTAGHYDWTSYHHDTEHCHGPFAIWLSTDGGATFAQLDDGVMTDSTPAGTPDSGATEVGPDANSLSSTYHTSFSADGANAVVLRFAPYSETGVHRQIWGMNGFVLSGGSGRPKARSESPTNGAMLTGEWVNLGWRAGDFAVSHDVYIGDNFDDVNDGTADTFRGNQPLTTTTLFVGFFGYPYPDGLVPGTTYYWRIDEVNDTEPNSPWKGDVWSFWIQPRIAYEPIPPDGSKFVDPNAELNWTAGLGAEVHFVYFGDNFDDVNSAVEGLLLVDTTYTPGTLEVDKTYYWRVDESADVITMLKGDVWSFKTLPDVPITDPNLLCWWKFDEGSGTTAVDYSGHNNHGTLMDDPQWVDGQVGGALEFGGDGGHVVDEDAENYMNGLNALTICIWIKSDVTGTDKGFIIFAEPSGADRRDIRYDSDGGEGDINLIKYGMEFTSGNEEDESSSNLQTTDWQHITVTTASGAGLKLYINGVLDIPEEDDVSETGVITGCTTLIVGKGSKFNDAGVGGWDGLIDDVRIYNKVLTADDITQVMRGEPDLAWNPKPAKGSTPYIREATPLTWSPGENASGHDVYFGTDRGTVADANASDTTGIYRGRQVGTSYTPPDVEWGGGPYYWRIDENNTDATISEGRIWNFTVADFIVIEDFEDYNDFEPDRIFDVWSDGWGVDTNGSEVGYADPNFPDEHHVETTIVHGGDQSMPYLYENNFKYSEATYSPTHRDWTEEGVGVLSLWFYGDAANAAERMYVALNSGTAVYNDNANASQIEEWTEWIIDLQEFETNLFNVSSIAIGFGDKNNVQAGGSGWVFFDDIRLYRPAP